MNNLSEYTLGGPIHEGRGTIVQRWFRKKDGAPVTVKQHKAEYPSPRDLGKLRHEHAILRALDIPGVPSAYALERSGNGLALILDYLDGSPLSELMRARRLDLAAVLSIAIRVAEILNGIHARGVIHRDIKPHNILVGPGEGDVHIIDFGIATRFSSQTQRATAPGALEGTLAYMSPEQTGRMNRITDTRTDLYSLGVTLYEALTGALPFTAEDAMDLVHGHVARTPAPPSERATEISGVVSDIVMRLLAKIPEDRYQTARGLKADLSECLRQWRATGRVDAFALGAADRTGELSIPQRLYGRAAESAALVSAWERAGAGATELVLLAGPSGVGKSTLVSELQRAVVAHGGSFAAGKFEERAGSAPYAPVAHALRELVQELLTERAPVLERFKRELLGALGQRGQVLTDLIPELTIILGPLPPAPALGPSESQNRFRLVLEDALRVFATKERPLVLFMDDLQWADPSSLALLKILLSAPDSGYLLLLGAYRDNEVGPAHPLSLAERELREGGVTVQTIPIGPLGQLDVTELLADTLGQDKANVTPLAALVFEKTQGNPFFLGQFLRALSDDGLLALDAEQRSFRWDIARIRGAGITDNVVELMHRKLERLAPDTQRALGLAACIGFQFELQTLARMTARPLSEAASSLLEALREGLIVQLDAGSLPLADTANLTASYRFLHDRVQQAAHARIDGALRREVHLRVGRLLRAEMGEGREGLFDVVHHLNQGASFITDPAERADLARLNLAAGRLAKARAAQEDAARYAAAGASLLGAAGWEEDHALCFELHAEQAECAYLSGSLEEAEALFDTLLSHARSSVEKARVHSLRIILYQTMGKFAEAVRVGALGLALFGVELPSAPEAQGAAIGAELAAVTANLGGRRVEDLIDAPPLLDPEKVALVSLLHALSGPLFMVSPTLWTIAALKGVNVSLEHGHSSASPYSYSVYGFMLGVVMGRPVESFAFEELALALNEKLKNAELTCKLNVAIAIHLHLHKPLRLTLPYLERGIEAGLASGDLNFASYACYQVFMIRMGLGDEIGSVREDVDRFLSLMQRTKDAMSKACLTLGRQILSNLRGATRDRRSLSDDGFDEAGFVAEMEGKGFAFVVFWYQVAKLESLFHDDDYEGALAMGAMAEEGLPSATGNYITTALPFYMCLSLAALGRMEAFGAQEAKLKSLALGCPENYRHQHALVAAEAARVASDDKAAEALYDEAIAGAREGGFAHHEALASELCARWYLAKGRARIARAYMSDAYHGYLRWGATARARRIAERYPGIAPALTKEDAHVSALGTTETTVTQRMSDGRLDAATALKAAQAIASEIALDKVLDRVMRIVVTSAGAERGTLILEHDGHLFAEARISIDPDHVEVGLRAPALESDDLPGTIVAYVARAGEAVVLGDARRDKRFGGDPYVAARRPKAILCLPLSHRGRLVGVLYLENNVATDAFTRDRIELMQLLSSHAATAVENALLYRDLETKVAQRTAELQVAKDTADSANQAKSDFLSSMSHELRSPLNGILGYAQILERLPDLPPTGKEGVQVIRKSGEHLLMLISDVLDLAKIEAGKLDLVPREFDFSSFVRTVVNLSRVRADEKHLAFNQESRGPGLLAVVADEKRLMQVLLNLLGNAIKFTEEGSVTLRLDVLEKNRNTARTVRFRIEDTGPGIAPEHLARIFEPFEQVGSQKAKSEGTGLGLAITKKIVEQMGGTIEVQSELGRGSAFTVTLAITEAEGPVSVAGGLSWNTITGYQGERRSILVVDDDPVNRAVLRDLLAPLGFEVALAESGEAALRVALEQRPALILMDLAMPGMDGCEATRRLRQIPELGGVVIVASSAGLSRERREASAQAGCDDFLAKPIEAGALMEQLGRQLCLSWIREANDAPGALAQRGEVAFCLPPAKALAGLLDLANKGRLQDFVEQVNQLEQEDARLGPFCQQVRALAEGFQLKRLREQLQSDVDAVAMAAPR